MRLSEAIRLGAMQGPQTFGQWADGSGSCALGAAAIAMGVRPNLIALRKVFPSLDLIDDIGDTLAARIMILNDHIRVSREQIATWIEVLGHDCESVPTIQMTECNEEAVCC